MEVGKREIIYSLSLHCHHQNDSCIKIGSDVSQFNVSLIVRDKVNSQDSVHKPQLVCWVKALLYVHRNRRLIRDGSPGRPPRLSHSSWALSCVSSSQFNVALRPQRPLGTGVAQDGHLDLLTAPEPGSARFECCFTSTETVGLLGTGAQDGHLDFHTAPELCCCR